MCRSTVLTVLILTSQLLAGPRPDSLKTYQLEDSVVVVANRYQLSLKNTADSYDIIPAEQIKAFADHSALEMVDALYPAAFIPDAKIMGYGVGSAGAGQVHLRGQGGTPNTGVLVLLNGHPDFMGIFGHPLPDVYGMHDIQQVEIISGPSSTVFGSQAMGGVINLVSLPDFQTPVRISAEAGQYNTYKLDLNLNKQLKNDAFFLTLSKKRSDGHIDNTSFSSMHFQGGWSRQIGPSFSLTAQGRYVPYSFDDPERTSADDAADLGTYAKIERATGEIIFKNSFRSLQGSVQLYTNYGKHRFYDGFISKDFTLGLSSYQNWIFSKNLSFAGGLDIIQYGGRANNKYSLLPNGNPVVNPRHHELNSLGVYTLAFYSPVNFLHMKAGLRYQHNSLPLDHVSPLAGMSLVIHPSLKLYADYQTGFRSPSLMELYLFPSANKKLEHETVHSIESGAVYSWANSNSLRLTLFRNQVENIIQNLPHSPAPPFYQFQNSGKARQWGIESQLKYRFSRTAGFQLGYSYLQPDELTAFNPQHQLKYLIYSDVRFMHISLYGKYVERLYAENKSQNRLPDYHTLNISLSSQIYSIELYFRVLNAFDKKYNALPGYSAPGRQLRLGTVYKF